MASHENVPQWISDAAAAINQRIFEETGCGVVVLGRIGVVDVLVSRAANDAGHSDCDRRIAELTERVVDLEAQNTIDAEMTRRFQESGAENWVGWVVEHDGKKYEISVSLVDGETTVEHISEMQAAFMEILTMLAPYVIGSIHERVASVCAIAQRFVGTREKKRPIDA